MGRWVLLVMGMVLITPVGPAAAREVYKLQISSTGGGGLSLPIPLPAPIPIDTSRQEWIVITVDPNGYLTVRHTTSVVNLIGFRTWHDHPATSIKVCRTQGFELTDCTTTMGDRALLPEGATIYDVTIEFKYVEGGLIQTQKLQLAEDVQPERG